MTYLPGQASAKTGHRDNGQVEYRSKKGSQTKMLDSLEWLAAMLGTAKLGEDGCFHVPIKKYKWS